jgi:CubicO group peptidase (beta-lactamase class C family)
VAIVRDGKVVMERGYGVRELGKPEPVTAATPFAIASNTKAFTAAALSILADQGKLKMDDRVIDHLPWFRMSDAYVTGEMRIRDLLSHRSGLSLGAGDLLFWPPSDYSVDEVVQRLAHVPLKGGFRDRYAYDNILYAVAQKVIEQVSGQPYTDFIQRRILDPVGMSGALQRPRDGGRPAGRRPCQGRLHRAQAGAAHELGQQSRRRRPVRQRARHGQWMNVQLAGGRLPDGKPLFSEKRQQEMWSVITPIPVAKPSVPEPAAATPNFSGYGEGWGLSDYRGHKLVSHTGGWPGMVSRTTLVPDTKLGIVVLTNQEAGAAFNAVTYAALDAFLGAPGMPRRRRTVAAYAAAVAKASARPTTAGRNTWPRAMPNRSLRCRQPPTPPPTATRGTATWSSRSRAASCACASPARRCWRARWSTGSTTLSSSAGTSARSMRMPLPASR